MKIKEKPEDFIVREIPNFSLSPKGKFSIFKLKKKLWNTEDLLQEIAKRINIPRRNIGFSGLKDKNAVTEQYISIQAPKEKVEKLKIKDVEITFVGKSLHPLSLGDQLGNEFEIIVTSKNKPKQIDSFINYFGEQRFSKNNAEIGRNIVKGNLKEALELIEDEKVQQHLKENPNDYIGSLKKIPLRTATIYIHAYQSLLWNKIAEKTELEILPMLGFATKDTSMYEEIMKEEGITKDSFVNRQWPELSAEGGERIVRAPIENLEIKEISKDKYKIKFFLNKGCYATTALNQIMP